MNRFTVAVLLGLLMAGGRAASAPSDSLRIHFRALCGKQNVIPDTPYFSLALRDTLRIEALKFYISHIRLMKNNRTVYELPAAPRLADLSDPASMQMAFAIPKHIRYSRVSITLGIDSALQVEGVKGGDLDPVHGMYWSWQSGYINLKLEGSTPVCEARKHRFMFHIGGYKSPHNTLQVLQFEAKRRRPLKICINTDAFFTTQNVAKEHTLMSPGSAAAEMSEKLSQMFSTCP